MGERVGDVEHEFDCEAGTPNGIDAGIWAVGLRAGSEIRVVPGRPAAEMIAGVSDNEVQIYTAESFDAIAEVLQGDIVEIGINSDYDATTRFATIEDPAIVDSMVDAVGEGTPAQTRSDEGVRYFVEFVHDNALVTVLPYSIDAAALADRSVGDVWVTAIAEALRAAPPAPTIDAITVSGPDGSFGVHPLGACRHDRVDATLSPGDLLRADYDRALELRWWLNTPEPNGRPPANPSQFGATLMVPNTAGSMIVEALLTQPGGVVAQHGCITIVIGAGDPDASTSADAAAPSGTLDCVVTGRELTVNEYLSADAATFDTIDAAVQGWLDQPDNDRAAPGLSPRMREFSTVIDLVNDQGRTQAVLMLADDGNGWFVQTEQLCPPS